MTDDQQPDPMAERRRNSTGHYDAVDAAIAARPKSPTHITRVEPIEGGQRITVDDGVDSLVEVTVLEPGRISIAVGDTGVIAGRVDLDLFAVGVLDKIIRDLASIGAGHEAPITGSR